MNTIRISVAINQKAALLKGLVLGPKAEMDVSMESIGAENWPLLVGALDMSQTPPVLGSFDGFGKLCLDDAEPATLRARIDQVRAHVAAAEAAKAAYAAERVKTEADEKAAKAIANAAKFATRLETGYWERETPSYNERRYGRWWVAKVTFPSGAKPHYEFGDSTGSWGNSGLLRIKCKPGEVIAWGQKDLRRPDRSEHMIQIMEPSGEMRGIDVTEAFRLLGKK